MEKCISVPHVRKTIFCFPSHEKKVFLRVQWKSTPKHNCKSSTDLHQIRSVERLESQINLKSLWARKPNDLNILHKIGYRYMCFREGNSLVLITRGYYMLIFISHPISTRDAHISQRADGPSDNIDISGWYGEWNEKCHIITYLSYTSMRLS
jgi:hypothetical protein